jgi:uncharacterized protein (TIGR02246 family)
MTVRLTAAVLFAMAVSLSSASHAQDAQASIESLRGEYQSAFNAGNASEVARVHAEDAVVMPPNSDGLEGRAAVESYLQSQFEQAKLSNLQIESAELRKVGDAFADLGTYRMEAQGPNGQAVTVTGDYMTLLEQGPDGNWLISRHIWNEDRPNSGR